MQEMHTMGGGRFCGGGGGGGDRRMRSHPNPNHQSLKCPRCESLHTKFCYYNNYNLSQPRHFCKSCRRYWTKGGVLRNVPVGGGCRKSKRSKEPKSSPTTSENATTAADTPAALPTAESQQELKSNSHSSSESSSLTAANTASAASAATPNSATNHLHMQELKLPVNSESEIPPLEAGLLEQAADSGIFSDIGSFMSLVPSTRETLPFGLGNMINPLGTNHLGQPNLGLKFPEITGGSSMVDQTVQVDHQSNFQNKTANGVNGFGSLLDWHGVGDQGLFDLANHNPVDQVCWTQNFWAEHDHTS